MGKNAVAVEKMWISLWESLWERLWESWKGAVKKSESGVLVGKSRSFARGCGKVLQVDLHIGKQIWGSVFHNFHSTYYYYY